MKSNFLPLFGAAAIFVACTTGELTSGTIDNQSSPYSRVCSTDEDFGLIEYGEGWPSSQWNKDPSSTTVLADFKEWGFTVRLPYNPMWGNLERDCQLSTFDKDDEAVRFGPAAQAEGGGALRFESIVIRPTRSYKKAIEAITEQQKMERMTGFLPVEGDPIVLNINGNTVVRFKSSGICEKTTTYEVIGKLYNYEFSSFCDDHESEIQAALETLFLY